MKSVTQLLVHPLQLGSVALLIVNDHYLKLHHPGFLSGKLSDIAFMVVCPIWTFVAAATVLRLHGRQSGMLFLCIAMTGALFCAMQLTTWGDAFYRHLLGYLQWPARSAWSLVTGQRVGAARAVMATPDPSDLFCLPLLVVPWILYRRCPDRVADSVSAELVA